MGNLAHQLGQGVAPDQLDAYPDVLRSIPQFMNARVIARLCNPDLEQTFGSTLEHRIDGMQSIDEVALRFSHARRARLARARNPRFGRRVAVLGRAVRRRRAAHRRRAAEPVPYREMRMRRGRAAQNRSAAA